MLCSTLQVSPTLTSSLNSVGVLNPFGITYAMSFVWRSKNLRLYATLIPTRSSFKNSPQCFPPLATSGGFVAFHLSSNILPYNFPDTTSYYTQSQLSHTRISQKAFPLSPFSFLSFLLDPNNGPQHSSPYRVANMILPTCTSASLSYPETVSSSGPAKLVTSVYSNFIHIK